LPSRAIEELFATFGPNYRFFVSFTAMLGTISAVLTATMINVAVPDIMGAFGVGQDQAQWLATGFLAAMTVAMLLNDWCVRAFGMRATYIGAMAVFGFGSVLGGMASVLDLIILGRVLQGAGAGLVQPLSMVLMFQVFPPHQRGRAMGLFGVGVVLAPALGPTLGGILVDVDSWRAVFFAAIPVSTLGMLLATVFMPWRDDDGPRPAFDWTGLILLTLFIGFLLTGFSNGPRDGWHSPGVSIDFAVAAVAGCGFVWWELRTRQPLFNVRLLANGRFAAAAMITVVFGSMLFGSTYLVPLFVQTVQGYSATRAGLVMIPAGLAMMVLFPLAGRLADRVPPHLPIIAGLVTFTIASLMMTAAHTDTPFWTFAWWLVLSRIGLAFIMPTLSVGAIGALPPHLVSQGAGAINFMRQLGGAFGVNLLAINLDTRAAHYLDGFKSAQSADNPVTLHLLREMSRLFDQLGWPLHLQQPGSLLFLDRGLSAQANMMAFRDDFLIVAVVSLAAVLPAWWLGRRRPAAPAATAPQPA